MTSPLHLTPSEALTWLAQALRGRGVDRFECECDCHCSVSISSRQGELEAVEQSLEAVSLTVTAYQNHRSVTASSTALTVPACAGLVDHIATLLPFGEPDSVVDLPDAADCHPGELLDHLAYCPDQWSLQDQQLMMQHYNDCLALDTRLDQTAVVLTAAKETRWLINSLGFLGEKRRSRYTIEVEALASDAQGAMQRYADYTVARRPSDCLTPKLLCQHVADRAVAQLDVRSIEQGEYPILFEAAVAKTLLRHFVQACSGTHCYADLSFCVGRLDQCLFADHIDIIQQPQQADAMGSALFDAEGVLTQQRHFVEAGVLRSLILDCETARRLGSKTTGNAGGVYNLQLTSRHPALSLVDMINDCGRGLLITSLMGQGVNYSTGDYSRAASGFYFESGRCVHAVQGITLAGNLLDIYQNILAVGDDVDCRASIKTGSLWVERMMVATDKPLDS